MNENQACWSQVHVTAFRCLRVKLKKQVLNRRLKPILRGGGRGLVLTQHLIMWSGNRWSTRNSRRVITLQPGALLEISSFFHMKAVRPFITHHYFFNGEDDYSQDRFPVIHVPQPWFFFWLLDRIHYRSSLRIDSDTDQWPWSLTS